MSTPLALPASALQLLAGAPHRLLFFVGASNVLLAMGWWTAWLLGARWQMLGLPQVAVPAWSISLLVAMVTRVTQGHSGRALILGGVAGFAFIVVQIVAVLRVLAEVLPDSLAWQAVAAIGWMLAFAPWVTRSLWIYLTPRIDGKPG